MVNKFNKFNIRYVGFRFCFIFFNVIKFIILFICICVMEKCKYKGRKIYNMNLEIEFIKGFLVSV